MKRAAPAAVGDTFAALADPTRRAVIELLRQRPHRAGELAGALEVSGPALSRHLRVLRESGLVADDEPAEDARVRLYRLEPAGFASLQDWVAAIGSLWEDQLAAFKAHAESAPERRVRRHPPRGSSSPAEPDQLGAPERRARRQPPRGSSSPAEPDQLGAPEQRVRRHPPRGSSSPAEPDQLGAPERRARRQPARGSSSPAEPDRLEPLRRRR